MVVHQTEIVAKFLKYTHKLVIFGFQVKHIDAFGLEKISPENQTFQTFVPKVSINMPHKNLVIKTVLHTYFDQK